MFILASGPAPDAVRDAARKVLEDGGYQTELPIPVEPQMPGWLERFLDWLSSLFSGLGGGAVIEVLFWIIVAVVLFFLLRWLFTEWQHRRKKPEVKGAGFEEVPLLDLGPLPDAEALAGAGEFAAAIHALLLHAQQVLVSRLKFDLRAALTSREVLKGVTLGGAAEEELRGLVTAVEISRFGGADVLAPDWDLCRGRYARFVDEVKR